MLQTAKELALLSINATTSTTLSLLNQQKMKLLTNMKLQQMRSKTEQMLKFSMLKTTKLKNWLNNNSKEIKEAQFRASFLFVKVPKPINFFD